MIGCGACKRMENEILYLQGQNQLLTDRLMAVIGKFEATSDAIRASEEATAAAELNPTEAEKQAQDDEDESLRRLDLEAEAELQRYADDRKVPVDALRDT